MDDDHAANVVQQEERPRPQQEEGQIRGGNNGAGGDSDSGSEEEEQPAWMLEGNDLARTVTFLFNFFKKKKTSLFYSLHFSSHIGHALPN